MNDETKAEIITLLTEMVIGVMPEATMRDMYGGIVIELTANDSKSRVGGIYSYAGHVSLEFTRGASFKDPNKILEGSGKKR